MTQILAEPGAATNSRNQSTLRQDNLFLPGLTLLVLGPTFGLLALLIFANDSLGAALHFSFRFYSPAVFVFQTPQLSLKYYGLFLILGVMVALGSSFKAARLWQMKKDDILLLLTYCVAAGALGARLYWVALCWPVFVRYPGEIFHTSQGGLSIHGCIIGVILAVFLYCRLHGGRFLKYLDFICLSLPLAQAIWRWGNLFNNEAFGAPLSSDALLQQLVPASSRPLACANVAAFHPAFLYEGIWDMALYCLLYFGLARRFVGREGVLSCAYLGLYSLGRILVESVRIDSITCGAMPVATLVSLICVAACGAALVLLLSRPGTASEST